MKLIVLFAALLGIFAVGCSDSPSATLANPTVSVSAVQTQAAGAVFATQTASVPKRTDTPIATSTPNATDNPNPTDTPQATATPKPTSVPVALTGKGQNATETFLLNPGLAIFEVTHDGRANIIVELLNDRGNSIDLIANDIGRYAGRKAVKIPDAGSYLLDVNADGNWSIQIQQPEPTASEPASPLAFKGCGQKVIPFIFLNAGLARFALKHEGKENFIVSLLAADGDHDALLANEIGVFDGSTAEGISDSGVFLLDVAADGNWTIAITQSDQKADVGAAVDVGACVGTGKASVPAPTQVSVNATPKPTFAPKPIATHTPDVPPVAQDQTVKINEQWDATLISVRRDKVLFGAFDNAETAFGTYATVLLRVKNNATGSDHVGRTLSFAVSPDGSAPIYYKLFNTLEDKAQYYYACCDTAFSNVPPGGEAVILMVFDVPEATKELRFYFTPSNPFEKDMPRIGPEFVVPSFDQIPPRGAKP